jgi:hypothetical protein
MAPLSVAASFFVTRSFDADDPEAGFSVGRVMPAIVEIERALAIARQ